MSQFVIQGLEETLVGERTRIVGLCATLKQEVEVDGQAAVLTRFESVTEQARFEVVSTSDKYQVLRINGRRQ